MACTLAGALVNVILDPVFIYPMKMGMAGAAIATILGQILTAALSVWYLAHMKTIKLTKKSFTLKKPLYSRFLPLPAARHHELHRADRACSLYGGVPERLHEIRRHG